MFADNGGVFPHWVHYAILAVQGIQNILKHFRGSNKDFYINVLMGWFDQYIGVSAAYT